MTQKTETRTDRLNRLCRLAKRLTPIAMEDRALPGPTDVGSKLVQASYELAFSCPEFLIDVEQLASGMSRNIRNLWIDEKRSVRDRLSASLEEGEDVAIEVAERALTVRSTSTRVRAEMARLPEEQRSVVMLVCVQGLSYQKAAAALHIPVGTLMSRLYRARLELARRMKLPALHIVPSCI